MKVKRNVFAGLGWLVWKLLAVLGGKYAKDRLRHGDTVSGSTSGQQT